MRYKVCDKTFDSFDEVVQWAWDEHFIVDLDYPTNEPERQKACQELEQHIKMEECYKIAEEEGF